MLKRLAGVLFAFLGVVICMAPITHAQSTQSPNYRFDESTIGQGGLINSSSANYQGTSSAGDLGVGESGSNNFNFQGGSQTTNDPSLAVEVNGTAALSDFSSTIPSTGTSTFTVSNYTSYGYVVNILGTPPTNNGHTIAAITAPWTSSPGFEQFGINLVANTAPTSFGANPVQGHFAFGTAATNYNTANQYRYVSGETIASAPKSSGVTTYTISYLVNVGALTPGGKYESNQTLIVTGTY